MKERLLAACVAGIFLICTIGFVARKSDEGQSPTDLLANNASGYWQRMVSEATGKPLTSQTSTTFHRLFPKKIQA
jgi:hypothetical protein